MSGVRLRMVIPCCWTWVGSWGIAGPTLAGGVPAALPRGIAAAALPGGVAAGRAAGRGLWPLVAAGRALAVGVGEGRHGHPVGGDLGARADLLQAAADDPVVRLDA